MAMITDLLSGGWSWIAGILAALVGLVAVYFGGKKIGTVQTQAKADVAEAVAKTEAIQASSEHESKVVKAAIDAKQDSNNLSDADLRERMRSKWTSPD